MNIKAFWNRVKLQIKARAATQADTAKACGVLPDTFRRWMSMNRIPPLSHSYRLARYLGVSLEYLIAGRRSDKVSAINEEVLALLEKASEKLAEMQNGDQKPINSNDPREPQK